MSSTVGLEEAAALEEAQDAALEDGREGGGIGEEVSGLIEADFAVHGPGEDAIEDHDVEVEVGVEGGAEAVEEGDCADLGVGTGARAGVAQAGADRPEQDPEHGAGKGGIVDTVLAAARSEIRRGQPFLGHVILLTADGKSFAYPIHDVPRSSTHDRRRTNEMAARKAAVRDMVIARDLDVLAVVAVAEAWVSEASLEGEAEPFKLPLKGIHPWMDPDRSEALVASVSTTEAGRIGMAPIVRSGGVLDEGPGRVGALNWQPMAGDSALMDGLFATTVIEPAAEHERAERAGRVLSTGGPS